MMGWQQMGKTPSYHRVQSEPDRKGHMNVEVFKGKDGKWYFRVKAANGEPIAHSEGYHNLRDAIDTAENLREHMGKSVIRVLNEEQKPVADFPAPETEEEVEDDEELEIEVVLDKGN
jgi:uncharacterized protein YegP (UPF0339 family)